MDSWLDTVEESLLVENNRQKIWDAMKGKDPEERLKNLLPTENLKNKFQETIKNYLKATFKEKTLSKDELKQLLVRKMLELTNPNSEYDILLFQKVKKRKNVRKSFSDDF